MQEIIYILLNYINNSISHGTNYYIATKMLENLQKIDSSSLEYAAALCDVSPATMNRFCKQIGYTNYSTFRSVVSKKKQKTFNSNQLSQAYLDEYSAMINNNIQAVNSLENRHIDEALFCLNKQKRCVVLGYGSYQNYALDLQKNLYCCGKFIEVYTDSVRQIEEVKTLTEKDVVIITSLKGTYIRDEQMPKLSIIKRQKCKIILITQICDREYLKNFDHVIFCGESKDWQASKYAIIRLYDLLSDRYRQLFCPTIKE